jgi:transposase
MFCLTYSKPFTLFFKYLSIGVFFGAECRIYTIIETAKMNGLNPETYLKKILSEIQDCNSQKIAELLPWNIVPDTS